MSSNVLGTLVALVLIVAVSVITFACYENAKSSRQVKQQKFNACLQAGGSPIITNGNNVMCIYGKG